MAPRTTPTARQQRFGVEVRRMREHAGLTAARAAELLGTDRAMISNIEAGRVGVSEERLRQLALHYECPDEVFIGAMTEMTGGRKKEWWEEYRSSLPAGFLDVAELEHYAVRLRTAQTVHLPGLLQTEDHARALFDVVVPPLPRLEVELRVAHRLERQRILDGDAPTPYTGIIHEAALRMQFGGRSTTRAQLEHLLAATDRANITLLVIPFSAGGFPGADQSILYAEGVVPELDTVQMDTSHGPEFIDAQTQLINYRRRLDLMEQRALSAAESQAFVGAIVRDL
ncbi:helix-turn-helix transcriptional regulator [Streptomyces sp. H10-C2]|uniref:helix-turn-helix domain-containing protein n=1 Tax=unclassified Streptomyces TaxID=2593676 RepID=UPI0024BBCE56|nr:MULTISPECIES: helix-turn-helix transcriptional regulator [unclassified Streptomyces]MDJ0341190.1 helix-turn-helix transcriptional regulator [Streptomyces sp. PH10-H1]MDJ0369457.1 helix-turn-helix transcriptional regulator [Streptomyces sp. H10-C2]